MAARQSASVSRLAATPACRSKPEQKARPCRARRSASTASSASKLIERQVDLVDHGGVDGIEFIGPIQAEQGDRPRAARAQLW